ncbi:trypsin-like peptidase domain-containing protein [Paenibacillus abyssi]|nr:trypsin-like peptidase domain-containing protein [Paenibacillus abyssi]
MKKKIILSLLASLCFAGVVNAAGMWGTYKGNTIIRLTVDGVPVRVTDAPAMLYDNRTMIPIYLLKEAGIKYTWDQKNQTVNIVSEAKPASAQTEAETRKSLTAREIARLIDRVGYVEAYNSSGNTIGTGSGFSIKGGWFISNSHVAYDAAGIRVRIDGTTYDTEGWYWYNNSNTDVFITALSTQYSPDGAITGSTPHKQLEYTTTIPDIGDRVYAIGSPAGLENTLSEGIVSGIRTINGVKYIQHTATIEPGSSGGVLLNEYGEAIGINTWKITDTSLYFAVPMQYVQEELSKS